MNLNISDRDKQLLCYVFAALLVLAAFYVGFMKFNTQADDYKAKAAQYQQEYDELLVKHQNKAKYIADTAVYNEEATKILAEYENGHSLENTIKYIYELEDNTEIFIGNFSIGDGEVSYSFADGTKQGITIPITFSYEASYDNLKKLIDYINTYDSKCSIGSVTIAYSAENDVAAGSITMNTYAVITSESTEPEVNIEMPVGNENIFKASSVFYSDSTPETGDYIVQDNDVYVQLVQPQANIASVSVQVTGSTDKPVTSNKNDAENVEIVFSGTEGNYTVAYKVGNTSYPARNYNDGVSFDAGDTIDVLVASSVRADANDKVTANVTLVNNTDKTVNIKVLDDADAKRFNVVSKTGKFKIFD